MARKSLDDELPIDDAEMLDYPQSTGNSTNAFMMGGIVPKFDDNYTPINIEETGLDLKKKAQDLISNICDIYYKIDEDDPDSPIGKYLEGLKKVEIMNLENLLLQVRASEHMLYSLLGRLNATGSIDNSLYKLISETQEKSIDLTLQVSNYIRGLPTYFKQLRFELNTNIEMVKVEQTQEMLEMKQDMSETDDPDKFIQRPQKGMRDFLKKLEAAEEEMKQQGEDIDENAELPKQPEILSQPESPNDMDDLRTKLMKENEN